MKLVLQKYIIYLKVYGNFDGRKLWNTFYFQLTKAKLKFLLNTNYLSFDHSLLFF